MKTKNIISAAVMGIIAMSPMFAFAQATPATPVAPAAIVYNGVCAKTEFLRHQGVISAKRDTMESQIKALEIKKRDAVAASYLLTDESARKAAMKVAEQDFKKSVEALRTEADKTAMKTENELFRKNMVSCGVANGKKNGFDKMKNKVKGMFNGEDSRGDKKMDVK